MHVLTNKLCHVFPQRQLSLFHAYALYAIQLLSLLKYLKALGIPSSKHFQYLKYVAIN